MTKDREEDSGLHDIRSLASSTKARLSSRRSTQNPVMTDDDVLASSSAGWKAVALPEPAKMVSLPELTELPSAKEIKEKDKADKASRKTKAAAIAPATPAVEAPASSSIPSIGSRIAAKQQGGGKGKVIAVVGLGLAAAAGVTFFVMNNKKDASNAADKQVAAAAPAAEYQSTTKMLPPPPPPEPAPVATGAAAGSAAPVEPPPAQIAAAEEPEKPAPAAKEKTAKPAHKVEIKDDSMTKRAQADAVKKAPEKKEEVKKTEGGEGEPSFDALLKEAGVSDMKKQAKPKLDKKSLSGGDIKAGMGGVAGKAQACYAGTQGTAKIRLTVTPDGKVEKVSVTGVFAGTPVASCIENAVKGAQFPPWDGGPQSFGYSYLLAE